MAEQRKRSTSGDEPSPDRDFTGKSAAELRDALTRNLIRPLELVMLSRERIQEVVDEAVRRGRMTADDAEEIVRGLLERGRRQTNDVLRDLEQLLGRGQTEARGAPGRPRKGAGGLPIPGYDELTAAEVQKQLGELSPAELRKLRDHERRNANRKSVLAAIEKRLA